MKLKKRWRSLAGAARRLATASAAANKPDSGSLNILLGAVSVNHT
jgi:hypothetical protein